MNLQYPNIKPLILLEHKTISMTIKTIRKPTVVQFTKYIIHSFAHITLDQVSIPKHKKKSRGHHHTLNHDNKKQVKLVKVKSKSNYIIT